MLRLMILIIIITEIIATWRPLLFERAMTFMAFMTFIAFMGMKGKRRREAATNTGRRAEGRNAQKSSKPMRLDAVFHHKTASTDSVWFRLINHLVKLASSRFSLRAARDIKQSRENLESPNDG